MDSKELEGVQGANFSYREAMGALNDLYNHIDPTIANNVKHKVLSAFVKFKSQFFFKNEVKPEHDKESIFSINVLIYCPVNDFHTIGFYNYEFEIWKFFSGKEPSRDFVWTYLSKPNKNLAPL